MVLLFLFKIKHILVHYFFRSFTIYFNSKHFNISSILSFFISNRRSNNIHLHKTD